MADAQPHRLILASGSPARRELLGRLDHPFEVIPADIDENAVEPRGNPRLYVQQIAWLKAAAVADRVDSGVFSLRTSRADRARSQSSSGPPLLATIGDRPNMAV
jgi:predicted house-cleaning NTP pyrophosphatase (Maf/HAM1 superfamily)